MRPIVDSTDIKLVIGDALQCTGQRFSTGCVLRIDHSKNRKKRTEGKKCQTLTCHFDPSSSIAKSGTRRCYKGFVSAQI